MRFATGLIVGALLMALLMASGIVAHPAPAATTENPTPLLRQVKDARATIHKVRAKRCLPARSYRWRAVEIPTGLRHHLVHQSRGWLARDLERPKRCLPTTWPAAVQWAQRSHPGTSSWLLSCSASEGGWGRWVPNRQGSGAGGWLQFMSGTFYANVDRALGEARARGLRVPSAARSWYSPAGQALTGASMYRRGLAYHWVGAGC